MAQVQIIQPYQPQSDALEKVAAYCRVSTDSKDQLNSYRTQIGYYTNFIAQHPGWELVDIYAVFDRFELDDLSFLNEQERHLDWTELNEELLSRRSAQEPAPVEDAVYESMQTQALREGVNQLPEVQKRRLQMYFFDGLTYEEIAVREGCSYQAVQKSIAAALKKIRKFLK